MISKTSLVLALVIACTAASYAQTTHIKSVSRGERLITAFAHSTTLPSNFGDDGVFVGDVSTDVLNILRLGRSAVPLLIKHLDDTRTFARMEFCCEGTKGPEKVTVGQGVLDLLIAIVRQTPPMFDANCLKEQSKGNVDGNCVADSFGSGKRGKQNWLKAYRAGRLTYQKYDH